MKLSIEELHKMTLEEAQTELSNRVYSAALFFEELEAAGMIMGNGHHIAQRIANLASENLGGRWLKEEERNHD